MNNKLNRATYVGDEDQFINSLIRTLICVTCTRPSKKAFTATKLSILGYAALNFRRKSQCLTVWTLLSIAANSMLLETSRLLWNQKLRNLVFGLAYHLTQSKIKEFSNKSERALSWLILQVLGSIWFGNLRTTWNRWEVAKGTRNLIFMLV